LLLAIFLVIATLYSASVPLGEGPDEPGHVDYAFFLARTKRLPVQRLDDQQTDVAGEGHQPPLAYMLAMPLALWLPPDDRRVETIGNPRFTWDGGGERNAISHGSREYPPWGGAVLAWHLMRLVSTALGAATVFFTYLAARALDVRVGDSLSQTRNQRSDVSLLAGALVAFNPQFLFISALVTNDALLATLSAVTLWLALRCTTEGARRLSQALAIGGVIGLALLTKQSALVLAPVALIAAGGSRRRAPRQAAAMVLAVLVTAGLIAGWWYLRNQQLYGDLLGLAAFRGEFATQPFELGDPLAWGTALAQLHASFWARFGWMNVAPPAWTLWLIGAIEALALSGLLWAIAFRWGAAERRMFALKAWPLLLLPALALAWIVSFAITAGLVAWQGRLLFPALPAVAILMAHGIAFIGRRLSEAAGRRPASYAARGLVLALAVCPLLLLSLWMPRNVIVPAYPRQTLPEAVAQKQIGTPSIIRFRRRGERSITLRGWRIDGAPKPGAALDLTLIWYASSRQMRDWVVFVQLIDRQGQVAAAVEGEPRNGAFPTTQWNTGDWIEDQHRLNLPATLAAGNYSLRMGLFDPGQENRRAGVYKLGGQLIGDALDLGTVEVGSS
jgi:hypothetical protein